MAHRPVPSGMRAAGSLDSPAHGTPSRGVDGGVVGGAGPGQFFSPVAFPGSAVGGARGEGVHAESDYSQWAAREDRPHTSPIYANSTFSSPEGFDQASRSPAERRPGGDRRLRCDDVAREVRHLRGKLTRMGNEIHENYDLLADNKVALADSSLAIERLSEVAEAKSKAIRTVRGHYVELQSLFEFLQERCASNVSLTFREMHDVSVTLQRAMAECGLGDGAVHEGEGALRSRSAWGSSYDRIARRAATSRRSEATSHSRSKARRKGKSRRHRRHHAPHRDHSHGERASPDASEPGPGRYGEHQELDGAAAWAKAELEVGQTRMTASAPMELIAEDGRSLSSSDEEAASTDEDNTEGAAVVLQSKWRAKLAADAVHQRRRLLLRLQALVRGALVRLQLRKKSRATAVLQRQARSFLAKRDRERPALSEPTVTKLQAAVRGVLVRKRLTRVRTGIIRVQARARGVSVRKRRKSLEARAWMNQYRRPTKENLSMLFHIVDQNGSGSISLPEFMNALRAYAKEVKTGRRNSVALGAPGGQRSRSLLTDMQMQMAMFTAADYDASGELDEDEFTTAFAGTDDDIFLDWMQSLLVKHVADEEEKRGNSLYTAEAIQAAAEGAASAKEAHERRLGALFDHFDEDGTGVLSIMQFVKVTRSESANSAIAAEVPMKVFELLDEDGSGDVTKEEFVNKCATTEDPMLSAWVFTMLMPNALPVFKRDGGGRKLERADSLGANGVTRQSGGMITASRRTSSALVPSGVTPSARSVFGGAGRSSADGRPLHRRRTGVLG